MPKRPETLTLPEGYAVIRRDDGYTLLRLQSNAFDDHGLTVTWEEVAGPYVRRSEAVRFAQRASKKHDA